MLPLMLCAQQGIIRGRVLNKATNEPVPYATVVISGTTTGATTTEGGRFELKDLEPGLYNLEVRSLGYKTEHIYEVAVTNSRPAEVAVAISEEAERLQEIEVVATPFSKTDESPVSLRSIGPDEIRRSAGGNRDISKVIRSLPGAATAPSFRNDIIIRGGAPSENKYYLDGVEVPNINHFQTQGSSGGPVGLINVDFIKEVDFYSGAFPANRGGALSSIFEFRQREGRSDKWVFNGIVGATDFGLTAEGPVGDSASIIVSVRRSYLQLLFKALELPFLPVYNDYQLKYQWQPNRKNRFTLISLGGLDNFELNLEANETEEQRYQLNNLPISDQWNYTIGGKWEYFRKNGFYTVVLSRNMLNNAAVKWANNDSSQPQNLLLDYHSQEIENKLRLEDYRQLSSGLRFTWGLNYERAGYFADDYFKTVVQGQPITKDFTSELSLSKWGVFGQASQDLLQGQLVLSAGFRMDATDYSGEMNKMWQQFSPRVSAAYYFLPKWSLNFNAGRYYQLPSYVVMGYRSTEGGRLVNQQNGLKYLQADHLVTGLEWAPNNFMRLTMEGFYKWYKNYPYLLDLGVSLANLGADFGVVGQNPVTSGSKGRAYGLEFLLQQKLASTFYGTLAYTLVRSEFTGLNNDYKPSAWDYRHIISLTGGKRFKRNWELGTRFLLSGGPTFTPYDYEASLNRENWDRSGQGITDFSRLSEGRLKPFHQLDVRIDKKYFFPRWSLNLYFDVQNLYGYEVEFQQNIDVVRDAAGRPVADPQNPELYLGKLLRNTSGTTIPTLGIIVEL
ncbi:TonB-dependent receptor plug [Flammeovirgaceae bacterium 311]|nr:TonB-dependent receptor plug [Flammeovirgaceae bacterium 311]